MVQAADAAWPVFGAAPQPMMMRQAAMATPAAMPTVGMATVPCAAFAPHMVSCCNRARRLIARITCCARPVPARTCCTDSHNRNCASVSAH
jgi:hypothetical protein